MADDVKARVRVPATAKKGDVIEIKTTISHPMENGMRKDKEGKVIPRDYLTKFECKYNGTVVFSSDWEPSVAANPFLSFFTKATESGKLEFTWTDEKGAKFTATENITVEG